MEDLKVTIWTDGRKVGNRIRHDSISGAAATLYLYNTGTPPAILCGSGPECQNSAEYPSSMLVPERERDHPWIQRPEYEPLQID